MAILDLFVLRVEPEKPITYWVNVDDAISYNNVIKKWNDDNETLDRLSKILPKYDVVVRIYDEVDDDNIIISIEGEEEVIEKIVEELELPSEWVSDYCYGYWFDNGFVTIGSVTYYCFYPDSNEG